MRQCAFRFGPRAFALLALSAMLAGALKLQGQIAPYSFDATNQYGGALSSLGSLTTNDPGGGGFSTLTGSGTPSPLLTAISQNSADGVNIGIATSDARATLIYN